MESTNYDASPAEFPLNGISYGAIVAAMTFGALVKGLREQAGLSMAALAVTSGLSAAARVREIEQGRDPRLSSCRKIAHGLGLTLTELVAKWEGIALTRARGAGRPLVVQGPALQTPPDIPEPRLFGGLISAWEMVPSHRRKDFVQHVVNYAASLASRAGTATGTDPKE
jgi:transcriptional regulator with XRE-family HTH domain